VTTPPARLAAALAGRYALGEELGAGGMATVYWADDLRHHRRVAVKVLRPELGALLGAERFLHEIRITAQLQHPHLLPLFDSGAAEELLWYVMPLVQGESLRDRLGREGRLPVEAALDLAAQVASALDYAHRHGIIHRDIKPANILLVEDQAQVADFGIALGMRDSTSRLTSTGLALGTPEYMSPEQAAGAAEVDARSDVYALGCVLFEMLTGRPPFTGISAQAVVAQIITSEPPLVSSLRPDIPLVLDGIVGRALARDPDRRYQTTGAFGAALRGLASATAASATAAVGRRGRRRMVVAGLVGVALLTGWLAFRPRPPVIPEVGQTTRITSAPGVELDPAISPDGGMLAYAAGPVGRTRIHVQQLGQGTSVAISAVVPGSHRLPRWSADGTRIAFLAAEEGRTSVQVVPALGGPARRLAVFRHGRQGHNVQGYAWSPDERTVVYAVDSTIYAQPTDGGEARVIGQARDPHSFAWCPDGAHLAVVSGNPTFVFGTAALGNVAPSTILVLPLAGGDSTVLAGTPALNMSPSWAPDGSGLYFVSSRDGARDIWYQPLDRKHRARGPPARLTTGLQAHTLSASADGTRLLYTSLVIQANIWRVRLPPPGTVTTPAAAEQLTIESQAIEGLSVSRDGRWLAFDSDLSGRQEIYRVPTTGGAAERLTNHPADDFIPTWSPDGEWIAFYSFRSGTRDVFVMRADGSAVEQVTNLPTEEAAPDWSPDGRSLVFHSTASGRHEVWTVTRSADGSGWQPPRRLTDGGGANPRWSPTGELIAFRRGFSVAVVSAQGGEARIVVPEADPSREPVPHWVAWSPDGRTIYYKTISPDGTSTIHAVAAGGGRPRLVVTFPDPARQSPRTEFATDGSYLYFTLGAHEADIWALAMTPRR
jgi:serine/threonine-protein kinase